MWLGVTKVTLSYYMKIECNICHRKLYFVNEFHLRTHGMTSAEYKEMFPGVAMSSKEHNAKQGASSGKTRAGKKRGPYNLSDAERKRRSEACTKQRTGTHHSEETKSKMRKPRTGQALANIRAGAQQTARREKISKHHAEAIRTGKMQLPDSNWSRPSRFWSEKNQKEFYCRSQLELGFVKCLEQMSMVSSFEMEAVTIPYMWEGAEHNYVPDILVTYVDGSRELIEVKPERRQEDERVMVKTAAAVQWCQAREIRFSLRGYDELTKMEKTHV
jgi:hypothetical protein